MSVGAGRPFWKMSGSGNDFVFLDARASGDGPDPLETPEAIAAICAQHLGVGADGVVFLSGGGPDHSASIRYYNSDGSRARLCGNASLCATQSAVRLGLASAGVAFRLKTDAGVLPVCVTPDDAPGAWVGLATPTVVRQDEPDARQPGELRIGFVEAGVPHVVILTADYAQLDIMQRGPAMRAATAARPAGANVNFVTHGPDGGWLIRTFERGVEAETLACGTGAIATATLLTAWGLAPAPVTLRTASGALVRVAAADGHVRLHGEGRLVFEGVLREVWPAH